MRNPENTTGYVLMGVAIAILFVAVSTVVVSCVDQDVFEQPAKPAVQHILEYNKKWYLGRYTGDVYRIEDTEKGVTCYLAQLIRTGGIQCFTNKELNDE